MGVQEGGGGTEQRSSPSSICSGSLSHLEQGSRVWSVEIYLQRSQFELLKHDLEG
jgi:hypothetical protein